jgi:hypothetical protein
LIEPVGNMVRRSSDPAFISIAIFARSNEYGEQSGGLRAFDVGLGVVPDHSDILRIMSETVHGQLEEREGWLAEDDRGGSTCIFQCRDERARIETELTFSVLKATVFRQRQQWRAGCDLAVGLI